MSHMRHLYSSPIFGPVHSRRLGVSLGINLLPAQAKICSFDCIYCECGFNADTRSPSVPPLFPTREAVSAALEAQLRRMQGEGVCPDVLTFAGNGEPTLHPQFPAIVDDVLALRDDYAPRAKVSVLSNATQILHDDVFQALRRVDNNILKLDTVDATFIRRVDRPLSPRYDVAQLVERMAQFGNRCIVQTMFLQGTHEGRSVSNLGEAYVGPWLQALARIRPSQVMVYTIDRETPSPLLAKATLAQMDAIAERVRALGIPCSVA